MSRRIKDIISEIDFYPYRIDIMRIGDKRCLEIRFKSFTGQIHGVVHILEGSWGWEKLREVFGRR